MTDGDVASLDALLWPAERVGDALHALARHAGLASPERPAPRPIPGVIDRPAALARFIERTAEEIGVHAELVSAPYPDAARLLASAGPGLVTLVDDEGAGCFLVVARASERYLYLLAPDLVSRRVPLEAVRVRLVAPLERQVAPQLERVLEGARLPPARRQRALESMRRQRLVHAEVPPCVHLSVDPGASVPRLARHAGVVGPLLRVLLAHAAAYLLGLVGWMLVGGGALEGRLDPGRLVAWALVLLTAVPLETLRTWSQGVLAIRAGRVIKQRLLAGALRLDPDSVRTEGAGSLLGRVFDAQVVETLALGGGVGSVVALLELLMAAFVLGAGAGSAASVAALVLVLVATLGLGLRLTNRLRAWTFAGLDLTHDLVERMVGHRTRLVQEHPDRWHVGEDDLLGRYLEHARRADRASTLMLAAIPRVWLLLGLAALVPAFVRGDAPTALAIGIGGTLLAWQALAGLAGGVEQLAAAAIAWRNVAPLWDAARQPIVVGDPSVSIAVHEREARASLVTGILRQPPVLEASRLVYRHRGRAEPVLRDLALVVKPGDRLLLQGASGGGKSTLGAVLAGLRSADSGVLLLHGLDRPTIGHDEWRRHIVAAPQFHENHVLAGSFAFNLLMGVQWPPSAETLGRATEVCEALGLGELLAKMPGGIEQTVGEQGWQLSHGERSRLFLARAVLADASLLILDESFGALDPETLERCLRFVLDREPALLVIAHP